MTEDEAFEELEARLNRQKLNIELIDLRRAHVATAEFIASQSADMLAITTLRKAFECGYRTGWREAKAEK